MTNANRHRQERTERRRQERMLAKAQKRSGPPTPQPPTDAQLQREYEADFREMKKNIPLLVEAGLVTVMADGTFDTTDELADIMRGALPMPDDKVLADAVNLASKVLLRFLPEVRR